MKLTEKKIVQLILEDEEVAMVYQSMKYALHRITRHGKAGLVGTEPQVRQFCEEFDRLMRR